MTCLTITKVKFSVANDCDIFFTNYVLSGKYFVSIYWCNFFFLQAEIAAAGVAAAAEEAEAAADAPDSDDDMGDHYDAGTSPQHRYSNKLAKSVVVIIEINNPLCT